MLQSLLDQAISFSQGRVSLEDALTVTGSVSQAYLNQLAKAIMDKDVSSGLEALEELLYQGKDPTRFVEDFILYFRDMLLFKTAPNLEEYWKESCLMMILRKWLKGFQLNKFISLLIY